MIDLTFGVDNPEIMSEEEFDNYNMGKYEDYGTYILSEQDMIQGYDETAITGDGCGYYRFDDQLEILYWNDQGFEYSSEYDTAEQMMAAWAKIEDDQDEWYGDEDSEESE